MSLLVSGSIGIDTVESPWGKVSDALGGSSVYFAYAASFFSPVRLVGVVGEDCPPNFLEPLRLNPRIDMTGLEVRKGAKTFRWHGRYRQDVNLRDTIAVELNVLSERGATIPQAFRDSQFVFLANTHPALQNEILGQLDHPRLVVADTMDLWIESEREALDQLIGLIDGLVLNDSEARQLTGEQNVIAAGLKIVQQVQAQVKHCQCKCGRGAFVIIKKGEHGSLLFADGIVVALPGYPAHKVVDPTGAGDSFAGAFMGYLAGGPQTRNTACGERLQSRSTAIGDLDPAQGDLSLAALRRAMAYGTVTASFTLEDFSLGRLCRIGREHIDARLAEMEMMLRL